MFLSRVISPFLIPKHWLRLSSTDFGSRAPHCTLMGAIDPDTGKVYVYNEYYKERTPVIEHQREIHKLWENIPQGGWYRPPVADPAGRQRSAIDNRSIYDHFAEYGIYFQPATNRIMDGLLKVYNYFSMDKLFIFSSCINTVREGVEYRYKENKESNKANEDERPQDHNDHAMDCLKYMIAELPDDPSKLFGVSGMYYSKEESNKQFGLLERELPYWLTDESNSNLDWY